MDVAGNIAFDAERACPERAEAHEDACRASDRICDVAAQVSDSDATQRCDVARTRCQAIGASASRCTP